MENSSSTAAFQGQAPEPGTETTVAQGDFKSTLRKNIYTWHRIIGLITIVPVICWSLSGLMHLFIALVQAHHSA